jgi:hypothetical protein
MIENIVDLRILILRDTTAESDDHIKKIAGEKRVGVLFAFSRAL